MKSSLRMALNWVLLIIGGIPLFIALVVFESWSSLREGRDDHPEN